MPEMLEANVALLPGDGIGPEVIAEATKVLGRVGDLFGFRIQYKEAPIGGAAIDLTGVPLPPATLKTCRECDAVLLGAVGGDKWDSLPASVRPEQGLLQLRKQLGLYANLRPIVLWPQLDSATPLRQEIVADKPDMLVVRELTGGLYYGSHRRFASKRAGGERAQDTMRYTTREVERVARVAFDAALKRRKNLTSVDKANVLSCSQLWRDTVGRLASEYPEVRLAHMYADNCAMQMVRNPQQFDVILTENTFGDILSDLGGALAGSLGMLPSASFGRGRRALYEPVHGSAPDIAGMNKANPLAAILSVAMMLRYTFGLLQAACAVETAVSDVLDAGYSTQDVAGGRTVVGTSEMGDLIVSHIQEGGSRTCVATR